MIYIVKDKSSLERLIKDKSIKNTFRSIKLELDNVPDIKTIEAKINKSYFACGCETGSLATCLTIALFSILWAIGKLFIFFYWWQIVLTIGAAALLGKLTGLIVSYFQLQNLYKKLLTSII